MNKPQQKDEDTLGSFYMGRMRPAPEVKRTMPKGVVTIGTLAAFAAIIWYAYPQGAERHEGMDVPVITADKEAYKFKPEDPGGMEVRHQDSTVFAPLEKKAETVERILPQTEEPLDKNAVLKLAPVEEKPEVKIAEVTETPKSEVQIKEEQKPAEPVKAVEKKAEPVAAAPTGGNYYMQLGSYRDHKGAKTDWAILEKKFPQYLKGLSMKTEKVDLGKKGVWMRLYAGSLSEAKAREICASLKTLNPGGCIVAKK